MRLHHIAIATSNIKRSIENYKLLYDVVKQSDIVYDPIQGCNLCLMEANGVTIEFVEGEKVQNMVEKGCTYCHVCYEVDDIEEAVTRLQKAYATPVALPTKAKLFGGRRIAFLYTLNGLVELLESK